jgi:hypothetical protein
VQQRRGIPVPAALAGGINELPQKRPRVREPAGRIVRHADLRRFNQAPRWQHVRGPRQLPDGRAGQREGKGEQCVQRGGGGRGRGQLAGEDAHQIVQPQVRITDQCGRDRGDQAGAEQFLDGDLRGGRVRGQCRHRPTGHHRHRQRRQRAQQSLRLRRLPLVAQVQAGPHGDLVQGQLVEPGAFVGQSPGQPAQRLGLAAPQPGAGDLDGQRQVAAGVHHPVGGGPIGLDPAGPRAAGQQGDGGGPVQRLQPQRPDAGQAAQPAPAGDQHPAGRRAGQQRHDLVGGRGVVQHDQDAPVGQPGPVGGRPAVHPLGHLARVHAEVAQQFTEHVQGVARPRTGAGELHEDLTIRVPVAQLMPEVHGGRGLADARLAPEHHHRHGAALGVRGEQPARRGQHVPMTDELPDVRRKLVGRGVRGRRPARRDRQLAGQDLLVQPLQLGTGIDAQLGAQQPGHRPVGRQRLGLPLRAIQRRHQLHPEPLPQRLLRGQRAQLADHVDMPAELQLDGVAPLQRVQPQLGQPGQLVLHEPVGGHVGQGRPGPLRDRRRIPGTRRGRVSGVLGPPGRGGVFDEPVQVEGARRHIKLVPPGFGRQVDRGRAECLAQPGDQGVQARPRLRRRMVTPQRLDELGRGHHLVGPQQQGRQQGGLPTRTHAYLSTSDGYSQWPE